MSVDCTRLGLNNFKDLINSTETVARFLLGNQNLEEIENSNHVKIKKILETICNITSPQEQFRV